MKQFFEELVMRQFWREVAANVILLLAMLGGFIAWKMWLVNCYSYLRESVALSGLARIRAYGALESRGLLGVFEQAWDKAHRVQDAGVASVKITAADRAECLDAVQGGRRRRQALQAAHRAEAVPWDGMVLLDPVVQPFSRDVADRVVRPAPGMPPADHLGAAHGPWP